MTSIDEGSRSATNGDLPVVTALARAAIDELRPNRGGAIWARLEARAEPIEAGLDAAVADDDSEVVVGTIDTVVVGYAIASTRVLHDDRRIGRVTDIYVLPEARGVGVGEAMMADLIEAASRHGWIGLDSLALPGDRATKNFFETHGLTARAITVHRSLTSDS